MGQRTKANGRPRPKFRVGEWVQWVSGISNHIALVIEDCGPVGMRARRYYRLREYPLWTDAMEFELAEDHLQPAERPESLPEPHDTIPVP